MDPGEIGRDDTESARLRRVEGAAVTLDARLHAVEDAVARLQTDVSGMRIEMTGTLGRVERDLGMLRAEEAERAQEARESTHWRRGLVRDGAAGAAALVRLAIERFSSPATLWPLVALVGILAAAGYGVAVTYDAAGGWRVGSSVEAAEENRRALPDVRQSDQEPDGFPVGPAQPQPAI